MSFPFKITKRISPVCFELETLGWSEPKFKVVRTLSDIKLYHGPDEFNPETGHNQKDYQTIHEFENYIDEEEEEDSDTYARDSDQNQSTQETPELQAGSSGKTSKAPGNQGLERIKLNKKWLLNGEKLGN